MALARRRTAFLLLAMLLLPEGSAWAANRRVIIGPGGFSLSFQDTVSGTNTTVIGVGDTVTWDWQYQGINHSTTSGTCSNGSCTPSGNCNNGVCTTPGTWDSDLHFTPFSFSPLPPAVVGNPFNQTGVFDYFCRIHGPIGMTGKVIVLNGPEFFLKVDNNSQFFPPPPIPTVNVAAGQVATFTGTVSGFVGFNSPVNLSCGGTATPRVPNGCPGTIVIPDGIGTAIPFSFSVADSVPGDYVFDIVAVGVDANNVTHNHSQQVKLSVIDLKVMNPSPATISAPPFSFSSQFSFQADTNLSGFVNFSCNGTPPGTFCSSFGAQFPPTPQTLSMNVGNFGGDPGVFPIDLTASVLLNSTTITATTPMNLIVLGPVTHLDGGPITSTVIKGTALPIQMSADDLLNHTVTNYSGTVHFTSSDPSAGLPMDYTFDGTVSDNGTHNFAPVLNTLGPRTIAVNDVSSPTIGWQSSTILVEPTSAPNDTLTMSSDHGPGNEAFFQHDAINLDIKVSGSGSTPTGHIHLFDGLRELTPPAGLALVLVSSGNAHAAVPTLRFPPGGHSLTVVYDGDSTFGANVSVVSQPRSPAPRCVGNVCPGSR